MTNNDLNEEQRNILVFTYNDIANATFNFLEKHKELDFQSANVLSWDLYFLAISRLKPESPKEISIPETK